MSQQRNLEVSLGTHICGFGDAFICEALCWGNGQGGVMHHAMRGAHASLNYANGDAIAIIPGDADCTDDPGSPAWLHVSEYADICIPTGVSLFVLSALLLIAPLWL